MQKAYNYLSAGMIVALLLVILMQKSCGASRDNSDSGLISSDTVTVEKVITLVERDTIYQDKYITIPVLPPIAQQVVKGPSVDSIRTYSSTQEDSAVGIYYLAQVQGKLLDMKLSYKLKSPLRILETVERKIIQEKIVNSRHYMHGFYVGASLSYSNPSARLTYGLDAALTTPKGLMYAYRYDVPLKAHTASVKFRLIPFKRAR